MDGDDFGIPPLRLVPGKYLEQLGRFPRSDEHEVVCSAVPVPLRPNHPTASEILSDFGVTFVRCDYSHVGIAVHCNIDLSWTVPSRPRIAAIVGRSRTCQTHRKTHNVEL